MGRTCFFVVFLVKNHLKKHCDYKVESPTLELPRLMAPMLIEMNFELFRIDVINAGSLHGLSTVYVEYLVESL